MNRTINHFNIPTKIQEYNNIPFPTPKKCKFTFIDLFAGIGGFHLAMQELGGGMFICIRNR